MRRRAVSFAFSTLAALALAPSPARAEEEDIRLLKPAPRQGYYLGGGLRQGGFYTKSADIGSIGPYLGFGGVFRAGQMANDWIAFGIAFGGGGGGNQVWATGFGALSLEVMLTPIPSEDLALRASIGVGGAGLNRVNPEEKTDKDPTGTAGALYTIGASYDLFPWYDKTKYESGGLGFTGFLELTMLPGDGLFITGLMLGLEVSYWFGFNKNKLEIPPEAY